MTRMDMKIYFVMKRVHKKASSGRLEMFDDDRTC